MLQTQKFKLMKRHLFSYTRDFHIGKGNERGDKRIEDFRYNKFFKLLENIIFAKWVLCHHSQAFCSMRK